MTFLSPLRLRYERNVITRVYRRLSGKGRLNIKAGQEVMPSEVIGTSFISSGFRIMNLANILSVPPSEVKKYLKKTLGQRIYKGELLALKEGWIFGGKKIVISPSDGTIDFFNEQTGEIKLSFLPRKAELLAGVFGIVEEVDEYRGFASIRTEVSRVFGLLGTGTSRDGILRFLGNRTDLIRSDMIKAKSGEEIIVGGSLIYKDAISAAISAGINGIITGGINAKDYKSVNGGTLSFPRKLESDIGISIAICEGFGSIPIGTDIYEILKMHEGKFVILDGNKAVINLPSFESKSMLKIRGTELAQVKEDLMGAAMPLVGELTPGINVRVVGSYFMGEQGKLVNIDQTKTLLPSGINSFLATIETGIRKLRVPVENLEIIHSNG